MALSTSQKNTLLAAYYRNFNMSVTEPMLLGTNSNERIAVCLAHLKGECEQDFFMDDLVSFDVFRSDGSLFGFNMRSITVSDMTKAVEELQILGRRASKQFEGVHFSDYVAKMKRFYAASASQSGVNFVDFAARCSGQMSESADTLDSFAEDDWFEQDDAELGIICESPEALSAKPNKPVKKSVAMKRLSSVNITGLAESGEPALQELLNNICWMIRGRQQVDAIAQEKCNLNVDAKLFLAAASGSTRFLNAFAVFLNKPSFLIQFPTESSRLRRKLLEVVDDRTTETGSGGVRGASKHWFEIAENLYKQKLQFSPEVMDFFKCILEYKQDGGIGISTEDIGQLSEFLPNRSVDEVGLLKQFVDCNISRNSATAFKNAKAIKAYLHDKVIGQAEAVESVSATLSSLVINGGSQHLGVSTFLGASGSGKTFLAECIADVFTDVLSLDYQLVIFNMEQYSDRHDVMKLFGSGSQYVDSALGGITLPVLKNPRVIFVFDEIEKAHPEVIQSLLTLVDKGYAEDRTTTNKVDFSLCHFIFTTNIGSSALSKLPSQNELDVTELLTRSGIGADRVLSPEMTNRLAAGNIAIFRPLSAWAMVKLAKASGEIATKTTTINWPESPEEIILATLGGRANPRSITTQLQKLEGEIFSELLDSLYDNAMESLTNVSFSSEQIIRNEHIKVSIISGNDLFKKCENDVFQICTESGVDSVRGQFEGDADLIVIDQTTLTSDISDIARLCKSFRNKAVVTLGCNLDANQPYAGIHRALVCEHFSLKNDPTLEDISQVLGKIHRLAALVGFTSKALARNICVDYTLSYSISWEGISASIQNLNAKQTVRAEDAELPFISFAGKPKGSLNDVIGQEDVKARLKIIVNALKQSQDNKKHSVLVPKGYLFAGLPGTGKTHMARCLAAESDMFYFNVNASDLLVGNAVSNINKLFDVAQRYAPSIIFFDEIDSIAPNRKTSTQAHNIVVNALLTALDGFSQNDGKVFVMAATNNPQALDPALTRAGRFERIVEFNAPCKVAREKCVEGWFKEHQYYLSEQLKEELTMMLEGATIGRIREVFNNSVLSAVANEEEWNPSVLIEEIRSMKLGAVCNTVKQTKEQIAHIAYHEAGHLVAHKLLLPEIPVEFASVQPRGAALGMVVPGFSESEPVLSKQRVKAYLQVFLAGIAAERMLGISGDAQNIGGSDDRKRATQLAKNAILHWGMSDSFGFAIPAELSIDHTTLNTEIVKWLENAFEDVSTLLNANKLILDRVSKELHRHEQLDKVQISEMFSDVDSISPPRQAA